MKRIIEEGKDPGKADVGTQNILSAALNPHLHTLADYLQKKLDTLSGTTKILLLCMFCFTGIAYSTQLMCSAIFDQRPVRVSFQNIPIPAHMGDTGDEAIKGKAGISESDYNHFRSYLNHLDSLKKSSAGSVQYEKLIKSRPGLEDSIKRIVEAYQPEKR